ncbi:beta-lactamase [Saccharomonospora viridis]|uniref:Beta-lactamase n=1 Tax=Saccharomonospora viridis TaxID=1852 RepID=A0A837D5R7_9PSEU|nr:beta-lactamase [Saccharomonospora viridis]
MYRIPLPMPQDGLRAVNVYVLESDGGLALVDAGWRVDGALDQLRDAFASLGRRLDEVTDVYVTHIHRDHYTLAPELRRRFGTRIHLGIGEAPGLRALQDLRSNVPLTSLEQLRRAGAKDLADRTLLRMREEPWDERDWEPPDTWLRPGRFSVGGRGLCALSTPGHTKGHLVFHDETAKLLFAGDHVLPSITPSIGFELGGWEFPLGRFLASLQLLLTRPDAVLLPAHGSLGRGVHERVRELLVHHEQRLAATYEQVCALAPVSGLEVAEHLLWTRRNRTFSALDDFNKMIAVCETMAHLDVLEARGRIVAEKTAYVARFHPAS